MARGGQGEHGFEQRHRDLVGLPGADRTHAHLRSDEGEMMLVDCEHAVAEGLDERGVGGREHVTARRRLVGSRSQAARFHEIGIAHHLGPDEAFL